jgi:hypothetical protein
MNWLMQNKTTVGAIFVAVSTPMMAFSNPWVVLAGQILLPIGTALLGGGVLRSDSYYRPYTGPDRRTGKTGKIAVVDVGDAAKP